MPPMNDSLKIYVAFINQAFDEAKDKLNFKSDSALAEWLGVTRMGVSQYRVGSRLMSDWLLIRLCSTLGYPPSKALSIILKHKPIKEEAKEGIRIMMDLVKGKK